MMLFIDFFHEFDSKNKATSNIKFYQVLFSIGLDYVDIYLRDGSFSSDIGLVNLHPSQGTHWQVYIHECYFDSYGCSAPRTLSKFIINQNGHCLFSECKIQGLSSQRDSYCAGYCSYINYLTIVLRKDFESVVLNLYYQSFS